MNANKLKILPAVLTCDRTKLYLVEILTVGFMRGGIRVRPHTQRLTMGPCIGTHA